jgi:hypothetical protein
MTKESDHSANLSKAREMLLVERRQLAAELTKSYKKGDGEKPRTLHGRSIHDRSD